MVTWSQVGIPPLIVDCIQAVEPSFLLDSLIHQLVFGNRRKVYYQYNCDRCGYSQGSSRASDEMTECLKCASRLIRATPSSKFGKDKIPPYTRAVGLDNKMESIVSVMRDNYCRYFRKYINNVLDCGWESGAVYCKFEAGDKTYARHPNVCLGKAAILCPYLWDLTYRNSDCLMQGEHISPILFQFMDFWQ